MFFYIFSNFHHLINTAKQLINNGFLLGIVSALQNGIGNLALKKSMQFSVKKLPLSEATAGSKFGSFS